MSPYNSTDRLGRLQGSMEELQPMDATTLISPSSQSNHPDDGIDDASTKIPKICRSLTTIQTLHQEFTDLKLAFVFPSSLDYQANDPEQRITIHTNPSSSLQAKEINLSALVQVDRPKLAYTHRNAPLHGYVESLNRLLTSLDGVESFSKREDREQRKVEAAGVENMWKQVWDQLIGALKEEPTPQMEVDTTTVHSDDGTLQQHHERDEWDRALKQAEARKAAEPSNLGASGTQKPTRPMSKAEWTAAVTSILVARFQKPSDITSVPGRRQRVPTSLTGDYTRDWIDGVVQECVEKEHVIRRECKKENRSFYPTEPHIAIACILGSPILRAERFPPDVDPESNSDDDTSSDSDNGAPPTSLDQLDDLIQRFGGGGGGGHTGWTMLKDCVSTPRKRENELSRHTLERQRASYTRNQELEERHRLLKKKKAKLDDERRMLADQIAAIGQRENALSLAEGQLREKEEDHKTTIEANMLTERLLLGTREERVKRREAALKEREEALGGRTDHREQDLSAREVEIHAKESKLQNDISAFEDAVSGRSADLERQASELQAQIDLPLHAKQNYSNKSPLWHERKQSCIVGNLMQPPLVPSSLLV
uniref:Uncharacterized protein n=1 Tax=Moniliophthora roreri TaxID=221103 RepID=A0A0W0FLU5_MONRR